MQHMCIGVFARLILNKPLYPYQIEAGNAILDSVLTGAGRTYVVMMARQSGKNQLSSILESYLLAAFDTGSMVKCAPTWSPQCITSKLRLQSMLEAPLLRERVWRSYGYIVGLASDKSGVETQSGPRIMFFSAAREANVVGATASLLLEIDEAQDVLAGVFDQSFRPMASTSNATTVLYGTAFSDDTLLAQQKAHNEILEEQDGIKRNYICDYTVLSAINPKYKMFVESEIARLGIDHPSIRTQYLLQPISGAGFLLNQTQKYLIRGTHSYLDAISEADDADDGIYVAGLDLAGENRPKPGDISKQTHKRDSTVLTIGRVTYNELSLPCVHIVHTEWFTGMKYLDQYAALSALMEQWNIRRLVVDKTGLGEGMASLLTEKFGDERVVPYAFTRPSKSKLAYNLLALVNGGRLKLYSEEYAPPALFEECWKQLRLARYRVPGADLLDFYVDASDGHDDFLMSIALCGEAIREFSTPIIVESGIVRPRRMYGDGRY